MLTLWRNARLATCATPTLGLIERGALVTEAGRLVYVGPEADAPSAAESVDCEGRWITPALIDCHTHLVYGGDRAREFELRLDGASYEEIARAGGGILSSVAATRAASEDALVAQAAPRLDALIAEGVGAIEIKSGYGLDLSTERKMLYAARRLGEARDVIVKTSFLGAHALPPEYRERRDAYVDLVVGEMLPALAAEGLVDAVDGFCESIAFTPAEIARVFDAARRLGLPVKLHAEQLSNQGGAALAASYGALSADHLEFLDEAGAAAMAAAGTVAVLLPGAFYTLRESHAPPVAALRRRGVAIAVATDSNPGTSPLTSLLTALNMAATLFRLTVAECLLGATRHAARALGLEAQMGTLEAGKAAHFVLWDIERPAELVYRIGFNPRHRRVWGGQ
jgi:imidazolonepropionase